MKLKVTVETIIDEEEITMRTYIHDGIMEKRLQIAKKVIDLEEKSIREALMHLGWRPPNKMTVCDKCCENLIK